MWSGYVNPIWVWFGCLENYRIGYCTSFHPAMKAIIFMHVHNYTRICKLQWHRHVDRCSCWSMWNVWVDGVRLLRKCKKLQENRMMYNFICGVWDTVPMLIWLRPSRFKFGFGRNGGNMWFKVHGVSSSEYLMLYVVVCLEWVCRTIFSYPFGSGNLLLSMNFWVKEHNFKNISNRFLKPILVNQ